MANENEGFEQRRFSIVRLSTRSIRNIFKFKTCVFKTKRLFIQNINVVNMNRIR